MGGAGMTEPTQTERVVAFIRSHPEATSLEITLATGAVNVTGRVSDARAQGVDIRCERRSDGKYGFVVRSAWEAPVTSGEQEPLFREAS